MASIPDVDLKPSSNEKTDNKTETPIDNKPQTSTTTEAAQETPSTSQAIEIVSENIETQIESSPAEHEQSRGVKACDDTRYRKYFKMLQFGVPAPAVKLKIANEGFDPTVLE